MSDSFSLGIIKDMIVEVGTKLSEIISSTYAVTGIYLISLFFIFFVMFRKILTSQKFLKLDNNGERGNIDSDDKKNYKVLSIFLSLICTATLYYFMSRSCGGTMACSTDNFVFSFSSMIFSIFTIFVAVFISKRAYSSYKKVLESTKNNYVSDKEALRERRTAKFFFILALFISSSLLSTQFAVNGSGFNYDGYLSNSLTGFKLYSADAINVPLKFISSLLSIANSVFFFMTFIFFFIFLGNVFGKPLTKKDIKESEELDIKKNAHINHISDIQNRIKNIHSFLKRIIGDLSTNRFDNTKRERVVHMYDSLVTSINDFSNLVEADPKIFRHRVYKTSITNYSTTFTNDRNSINSLSIIRKVLLT